MIGVIDNIDNRFDEYFFNVNSEVKIITKIGKMGKKIHRSQNAGFFLSLFTSTNLNKKRDYWSFN